MTRRLPSCLLPNRSTGLVVRLMLSGSWVAAAVLAWAKSPYATLPTLPEVLAALRHLWWERALGLEFLSTLRLIGHALLISVGISLFFAYSSVLAVMRPLVVGISKLRFAGVTALVTPLTLATGGGYNLKVTLLIAGISTFLTTAIVEVVDSVPQERLDYLRTLGASEWGIVWEGVILGTLAQALDAIRQNLAMAWAMITMVEGISRASGGIGAMMVSQEKHWNLAELYAVLLVILALGLAMDWLMATISDALCPHAPLERARK